MSPGSRLHEIAARHYTDKGGVGTFDANRQPSSPCADMRFRAATRADIPAIVTTFDGRNALPMEPRVRAALPSLLERLIESPASTLSVFEEEGRFGLEVFSVAGGLFLRDDLIEQYLAAPSPGLVSHALAAMLEGRQALLTFDEIRRSNSGPGLALAVLSMPYGRTGWNEPSMQELRKLAPQAFVHDIGGYRLRAIYYEVFTDEAAQYIQAGGYRLLHDFSSLAGTGWLPAHCHPRMLRLTRADLPPGAMSFATQMFDPPQARLGLTPAEQRIALHALQGASDRAVAETLGLSTETLRTNWRSIYRRMAPVLALADAPGGAGDDETRGREKRRFALEYLRQNMQELRPTVRSQLGRSHHPA